jgi:hypothetical protein
MDLVTMLEAFGLSARIAVPSALLLVGLASIANALLPRVPAASPWAPTRALLNNVALGLGHARPVPLAAPVEELTPPLQPVAPTPPGPVSNTLGAALGFTLLLGLTACGGVNWNALLPAALPAAVCALDAAGQVQAVAAADDENQVKAVNAALATGGVLIHDSACQAALAAAAQAATK